MRKLLNLFTWMQLLVLLTYAASANADKPRTLANDITSTTIDSTIYCFAVDSNVCEGEVITYSATSKPGLHYFWNVTGGTAPVSTTNLYTVTWGSPGSGTVTLIIKDNAGNVVKTCQWNATIHGLPDPVITASFSPTCERPTTDHNPKPDESDCLLACDSSTVVYTVTADSGSTYAWSVSGAISYTTSGNEVSVYWGSVGSGMVTATVTNAYGCSSTVSACIDIIPSPTALFATTPAAVGGIVDVCLSTPTTSQAVYFTDLSTGSIDSPLHSWFWDFGDGTTSDQQHPPAHVFPGPGVYDVWLVVENECHCKDSFNITVNVSNLLGPDIYCAATVCADGTETYSTSANCTDYLWNVTGGTIVESPPYGPSITVNWGSSTPGTVSLAVDGCDSTYCSTATEILIPIIPPTTTIDGPAVVCAGSLALYSVDFLPGCTYDWDVSGGGTIIGIDSNNQVLVQWSGTGGTVKVTYDNPELGCSGMASLNVQVLPEYDISGPEAVCVGESATYVASTGSFDWTVLDASGTVIQSSSGSSITVNWATSGNYQVVATDALSAFCNSPQALSILVSPAPPAPTAIVGEDSICSGVAYTYTASPSSLDYYLEWVVSGGTPVNGTGNSMTITWGVTPPYTIDLYQVNVANPSCSSMAYTKTIYPKVLTGVDIIGPDSSCTDAIVSYSAVPLNADDYQWSISPSTMGSVISGQGTTNIDVQWNNTTGSVTLTLVATACNNTVTVNKTVILTGPPPPVILANDSACQGANYNFSSSTTGTSYTWDFGDGNSTTSASPAVFNVYALPGNYLVTLTVNNPGGCVGTSTTSKWVLVNEAPAANLTTPDPTQYCPGDPISTTLYINSQPGNTFQWFGPGTTGVTATSFNATAAGSYYVVVTNSYGCTNTSNTIKIKVDPCDTCNVDPGSSIDFTYSGPNCNVVDFFGNISGGTIIGWNFNDPSSGSNTSTALNPSHTFSEAGYYNVTFKGRFPGTPDSCILIATETIVIPAVADFEWEITGCAGGGFTFDFFDLTDVVSPYTVTSWNWTFAGGTPSSSTAPNPSGVILSPGTHIVSLTVTSSGGTTCIVQDTIVVPALPLADFTAADTVCDDNAVLFTSTASGTIVDWLWDFGDLATSKLYPTTERTYSGPGTYTATLTVTDENGCTAANTQQILVLPNTLNDSVIIGGPTVFCAGDSVQLTAAFSGGSMPYNYLWSNLDSSSSITVDQNGNYTVTVTDADGCQLTSNAVDVIVNPAPTALISGENDYCMGDEVVLTANQGASSTYEWFFDNVSSGSSETFTFTATYLMAPSVDVYVVITAPNGCVDTSDIFTVYVHSMPLAPTISTTASPPLCSGTPIELTASNTQGLTDYIWNTGQTDSSITVSTAGVYSVTVFNEYGCGKESSIYVTPMPDFTNLMTGCYSFCDTADVLWIGPIGPYTYQWLFNGAPIAGATSANYTIPAGSSGMYQLVIDNGGCVDTSGIIDIDFYPCADPCEGPAFIKTIVCDTVDGSGNQTYWLDIGLNNPFGGTATFTMTTPLGTLSGPIPATLSSGYNSFNAIFTENPPGGYDTLCIEVVITNGEGQRCMVTICKELPDCGEPCEFTPDFTYHYTQESPCHIYFSGSISPAGYTVLSWDWDFGDGFSSTLQNPIHNYGGDGTYTVCLTVTATNGSDT
jgi:PKD repeat protein